MGVAIGGLQGASLPHHSIVTPKTHCSLLCAGFEAFLNSLARGGGHGGPGGGFFPPPGAQEALNAINELTADIGGARVNANQALSMLERLGALTGGPLCFYMHSLQVPCMVFNSTVPGPLCMVMPAKSRFPKWER